MTPQILNVIHAVRDYRRWIVSHNFVCPKAGFNWYEQTENYFASLNLPDGMKKNRRDLERIFLIPQYVIDRWDEMVSEELEKENWK